MATTTTVTTTPVAAAAQRQHHAAPGDHVDHVHGDMDVRNHERTFDGFVKFMTWNTVAVIVLLIFLALAGA